MTNKQNYKVEPYRDPSENDYYREETERDEGEDEEVTGSITEGNDHGYSLDDIP